MIRVLAIVVGLALGAALALVSEARLDQLRPVVGRFLPAWTARLDPSSSLFSGRIDRVATLADGAPVAAGWRFRGAGAAGLHFDVDLDGAGLHATLRVVVTGRPGTGRIVGATGEAEAGRLLKAPDGTAAAGRVLVDTLAGTWRYDLSSGRLDVVALTGKVVWQDVSWEGLALGQGEITLEPTEAGAWTARVTGAGPALSYRITLTGRFGSATAKLAGTMTPGKDSGRRAGAAPRPGAAARGCRLAARCHAAPA